MEGPLEVNKKQSYFEKLRRQECIVRAEEGMNLNAAEYPIVPGAVPEDLWFDVEGLRNSVIRFLNSSLVADSFSSHEERVAWYNQSGVLSDGDTEFYRDNKLRLNIVGSVLRSVKAYGTQFKRGHEGGVVEQETKLLEALSDITTAGYEALSAEEKLALVEKAEALAKYSLNEMIEFGWIEGERVG